MTAKCIAFAIIDRMVLVVHGSESPSDKEWARYLEVLKQHGFDGTTQLLYSDGGGPSPTQRRDLHDLLDGRTMPVAVLSDSAQVHGMVTAMSWFNPQIRAFPPAALREALAYLGIPANYAELIEQERYNLRLSLGAQRGGRGNHDAR
jgi:hypothetical protein